MGDFDPHFTAKHFIDYICAARRVTREDFNIRPDVIVSYVGDLQSQAPRWDMDPLGLTIHNGPIFSNQSVTLLKGPIGAPLAAGTMEELAELGAKRLWVLGYAGSLDPRFSLGSVVLVTKAWVDEGTSHHYGQDGWGNPDPMMTARLAGLDSGIPTGNNWTTDAIYRETPQKIRHFTEKGCQMVDMETSCYFHVGSQLGLSVAALMVISDELFHPWNPGFGSAPVRKGIREAYALLGRALDLPNP